MDEHALARARQRLGAAERPHRPGRPRGGDRAGARGARGARRDDGGARGVAPRRGSATRSRRASAREVLPVARQIAEIRGLLNQAIRRLERLEGDLLAERHARVDDLALLVDLVSSGWKGVDERLARIETPRRVERPRHTSPLRSGPSSPPARAGRASKRLPRPARCRRRSGRPAQTRARARSPGRARFPAVVREEGPEDPLQLLGSDARPTVADRDLDDAVLRARARSIPPPSGVQRNAFESRFVMIWSTRSPSVTTGLRTPPGAGSRSRGAGPPR